VPSNSNLKGKAMSYRIAISFAAAAIAISYIATDASAGGRGGSTSGGHGPPASANNPSSGGTTSTPIPRVGGAGDPTRVGNSGGPAGTTGSGAAGATDGRAPASYYSNPTACGRYPYPPCKKVPAR